MGEDNGMEESVDSGKGGCVGPYFIIYVCPVHSYLAQSEIGVEGSGLGRVRVMRSEREETT